MEEVTSVLLAIAMLIPAGTGASAPTGHEEARSTVHANSTLMVSLCNATSIVKLQDGNLKVGLYGGGIAEWTTDGTLLSLDTSLSNQTGGQVTKLVLFNGTMYAGTMGGLFRERSPGHWVGYSNTLPVLSLGATDEGLFKWSGSTSLSLSSDGFDFSHIDLPTGLPASYWTGADIDGDLLALTNGTGLVIVNVTSESFTEIGLPTGPVPSVVTDLAIADGRVVVATGTSPDIYDIERGEWLASDLTVPGGNWTRVFAHGTIRAGSRDGWIVEHAPGGGTGPDGPQWRVVGRVPGTGQERAVTDLLPLGELGFAVATPGGTWIVRGVDVGTRFGEALSYPPSSDMLGVEYAGGILWALSGGGLSGLSLNPDGSPGPWDVDTGAAPGTPLELRDSAELGGTVYLVVERGIWTYDLFASSRPSRWNVTHASGEGGSSDVRAVCVLDRILYAGGPFGIDVSDSTGAEPGWSPLMGAPSDVRDLTAWGDRLLVATCEGVWSYDAPLALWTAPSAIGWAPERPIDSIAACGDTAYATSGDMLYWTSPTGPDGSIEVPGDQYKGSKELAGNEARAGPIWGARGDIAFAYAPGGQGARFGLTISTAHWECRSPLGGARVRDVAVDENNVAYLATELGVQRIGLYTINWTSRTTAEGLSANDLRSLMLEPGTDRLWIAAYGGVDVLDTATGAISSITTDEGLPSNLVYQVMAHGGDAWVATDAGGAARRPLGGGGWTVYNMTTGLVADDVQALDFVGTKAVLGTDSGVTVLDLATSTISTHTQSSTAGRLPSDWVNCELAVGASVWVGTNRGLCWYDPSTDGFALQSVTSGEQPGVRSLALDTTGRLWVGTERGLFVLNVSMGEVEADLDHTGGLPSDSVLALMQDSGGWMWAGTAAGVSMVDMSARALVTYTTRDGLVHDRVTSLAEHPDGTVWVATAGGLSRLDRTRWDVLPQWSVSVRELPDIAVSLEGIRTVPDSPNEGQNVTFNVTVTNPSRLNALATIALMSDDHGSPGAELAYAIAYTTAGGCYTVELGWTAVGGEVQLWIVADPDGKVPESDRRNNRVSFGLHVNRMPVLSGASIILERGSTFWMSEAAPVATFRVNVTYRDLDGDLPVGVRAGYDAPSIGDFEETFHWNLNPVATAGNVLEGLPYSGQIYLSYGDHTIYIAASDGLGVNSTALVVPFHFNITVSGIAPGDRVSGRVRIEVAVTGPWEGNQVTNVEAWYPMYDTRFHAPGYQMIEAMRDDMNLTLDFRAVDQGTHDIWFVAFDDRGMVTKVVVPGVIVTSEDDQGATIGLVIALTIIALAIVLMVSFLRIRSIRRGPD